MKKNLKKMLSLLLTFAVVLSTVVFTGATTVFADGWTDKVLNFDELTEIKNEGGFSFSGVELVTDAERSNVVKVPTNGKIDIGVGALSSGVYTAKASVKIHGVSQRFISMFITSGGNKSIVSTHKDSTNIYMTTNMDNKSNWTNSATYESDVWYDIESVLDLDSGYYSVKLIKDGETVAYKNGLPVSGNVNNFRITVWNGEGTDACVYVDNMEFVKGGAVDKVILNEDFSKYTAIAGTPVNTSVANNGWAMGDNSNLTTDNAELKDGALEIKAGKTVRWQTPFGIPSNGKIRVSTKIKPVGTNNKIILDVLKSNNAESCQVNRNASAFFGAIFAKDEKQIWTYADGAWADGVRKYRVSEYEFGKWYDISMVLNMDTKTYNIQVSHDGSVLGQIRDLPFAEMNIQGIQVTNWTSDGSALIDDVKIEYIKYESDADRIMASDDFSNVTSDNYTEYGWMAGSKGFGTVNNNESVTLNGNDTGVVMKLFGPSKTCSTGKYKVSFSANQNAGKLIAETVMVSKNNSGDMTPQTNRGAQLVTVDADSAYHRYTYVNSSTKFADVVSGDWYDYEIIFDMTSKTKEVIITDKNGNETSSGEVPLTSIYLSTSAPEDIVASQASITYFTGVQFRNWSEGSATIDNLKIEYYVAPPKMGAKRIAFTDSKGNVCEDTTDINPALSNIALDFGTVVTEASAADIEVSGGTKAIIWDGEVSDNKYMLTPNVLLEEKTTYTITVPATVGTDAGTFLGGEGYTFQFTTGELRLDNKIISVYNTTQGKDIATIADLAAGDTVTINTEFINPTDNAKSVTWIMAYYDENGSLLETAEIKSATAEAGAATVPEQIFTVPSLEGIDIVKIFLWDSVNALRPYSTPIIIGQAN